MTLAIRGRHARGRFALWAVLITALGTLLPSWAQEDEAAPAVVPAKPKAKPAVAYLTINLPIKGLVDTQVMQQVEHALQNLPTEPRPILIFEFSGADETSGEESQFERALSLARFLSGEKLRRARTIAYLPKSVTGHAVLPVMACEQIIMHPDADLGNAGIGEETIDGTMRNAYIEVAERRRSIPPAIAIGMLDRSSAVSRVQTAEGARFVLADELAKLQEAGLAKEVETVIRQGDLGLFSGNDLRVKYSLVSHLVSDKTELAAALELPRDALEGNSLFVETWRPIEISIDGPIHPRLVTQITRGVNDALRDGSANVLIIRLRSGGGDLGQSVRLASFLAHDLDPRKMRSVVFVQREARADAALIALAADDLVVTSDAVLGGPGNGSLSKRAVGDVKDALQQIATTRGKEWSLLAAMIDPSIELTRWNHARRNETRFLSNEESDALEDKDGWVRGEPIHTSRGLLATELNGTHWLHGIAADDKELAHLYSFEGKARELKPNWALGLIEVLADPRLAVFLLSVAWFALMIEISTPGVGVPGFIAALCFLLFFWSQFLHGNANVLEILLFVFGVICVAVEIFVMPGVGIFGFGGGLLILVSMVLASQTFVIPANTYQLRQLPISLLTVAAAAAGGMVALVVARRFLHQTPFFNRLLLQPPQGNELEDLQRRESFGEWTHLLGKRGHAMTPLVPSGRVRIGEELVEVLSEGELIERGTDVEVVEVQGTRVIVRRIG